MLLVQEYLKYHTFEQLEKEHGVCASFSKSKQKVSLNYNQLISKDTELLSNQCRGLILSKEDNGIFNSLEVPGMTKIVACPFFRFFNYGQPCASQINWNSFSIFEKLDGTLIIIYYDYITSSWCVATRSVPDADIVFINNLTFRDLFNNAIESMGIKDLFLTLDKNNTYMCELTSPYNMIVVNHSSSKVTLLGVRNNLTLQEYNINNYNSILPKVESISISNVDEIISYINARPYQEHEGVVVCDNSFNRIKIKSASYILAHRTADSIRCSDKNIVKVILSGKEDDIITLLPIELQNKIHLMKDKIGNLIIDYDKLYLENKCLDKKEFALKINNIKWRAPLFAINNNLYKNINDYLLDNINNPTIDKILELIEWI